MMVRPFVVRPFFTSLDTFTSLRCSSGVTTAPPCAFSISSRLRAVSAFFHTSSLIMVRNLASVSTNGLNASLLITMTRTSPDATRTLALRGASCTSAVSPKKWPSYRCVMTCSRPWLPATSSAAGTFSASSSLTSRVTITSPSVMMKNPESAGSPWCTM